MTSVLTSASASIPAHPTSSLIPDRKTDVLASIIRARIGRPIARALVVGCGSGREAAALGIALGTRVVGIDVRDRFDAEASRLVELRRGDATQLEFDDGAFDLVYSFHVLEHIPRYRRALSEMRRVLAPGGHYCVGTPNRTRLVGYLGSRTATLRDKIAWNLADWRARLRGRFRNEYGAHAGFTRRELSGALLETFSACDDITLAYYAHLYRRRSGVIRMLEHSGLSRLVFPAIYFMGSR